MVGAEELRELWSLGFVDLGGRRLGAKELRV